MERIQALVDRIYKENFGRLVASLIYSSHSMSLETAEDIVQDSFSSALSDWKVNGIPVNAAGWIYKVCRNNALNKIKQEKKITKLANDEDARFVETRFSESVLGDHQLQLLFSCANPGLAPKVQVVITLKYVVNLRVEAIAKVLAMSADGVDKLLVRARQKIRNEKILLEEPIPSLLEPRVKVVHKILYLIFNEGYKSSWGKEMIREELCEEALVMCKMLLDSGISNNETSALYALMLFNSARFDSRFGSTGELLDLEHQNRSLWNKDLIRLGSYYLKQSGGSDLSSYHLEASIACVHSAAVRFEDTKWTVITGLYSRLLQDNPNPFVELNYSIALYYSGKKESAFTILETLSQHPFMSQYSILNSTIGKLHGLEGRQDLAIKFLLLAQKQTCFKEEKEFIHKMIERFG
jgi:RNA polymerase sigma factor (sigma-70 family)